MVLALAMAASSTTRMNSSASSNSRCLVKAAPFVAAFLNSVSVSVAMGAPSESVDAGDVRPDDEGMDVVRALVGLHRFQVHHVAHDGIVVGDAVGAQDVARQARALQRHPNVVLLGHGDMVVLRLVLIL